MAFVATPSPINKSFNNKITCSSSRCNSNKLLLLLSVTSATSAAEVLAEADNINFKKTSFLLLLINTALCLHYNNKNNSWLFC